MDLVTAGLLRTWAASHGVRPTQDEARSFETFVNYIVLARHQSEPFDVDEYGCGESGTLGIDGFALTVNGELIPGVDELEDALDGRVPIESSIIVVQAKRSASFDLGQLSVFADTATSLLTQPEPPHPNLALQHAMLQRLFKESSRFVANPSVRLYFVTTGTWTDAAPLASKIAATVKMLEESNLFSRVDFHPWGARQIQDNWRAIDSALEVTVQFDLKTTLPDMLGVREAYLGVLPGLEFVKLVTDEDGDVRKTLFFDNVRDFMGDNDVNKDIEATLKSDAPSRFCVLNNGVTVVANDLRVTGNRFTLKNYQVVNGCQTSHILHRNRDQLKSVYVPFRLIVASDDEVTSSITKATNKQSSVTPENLMSLSEIQRRIEAYFDAFGDDDPHRVFYERRARQWSGSQVVRSTGTWRVITLRNLMQAFASLYLRTPWTAARYYRDLRARAGAEIFSEEHHPAYYYSAAYAFCKLDHFFRSDDLERGLKPARYYLLAGVRTLSVGSLSADRIETSERRAEQACKHFNELLWNDGDYLNAIRLCARVLTEVAKGQAAIRDFARTREATELYLKALLSVRNTGQQ